MKQQRKTECHGPECIKECLINSSPRRHIVTPAKAGAGSIFLKTRQGWRVTASLARGCCLGAAAALLMLNCIVPAQAELNSKQRVQAFAKLPDWSGLWEQFAIDASGGQGPLPTDSGSQRKGGEEWMTHPPYNAEWEAKFQDALVERLKQPDQPICTFGFPTLMIGSPLMFQAIVTPEETTLIFSQRETRHIYTNGSPHPAPDELWAMPWGNSIGHWEKQTLVVDTIATSSSLSTFDKDGPAYASFSNQARFIERIRMTDKNTLENQITIEDPVALLHPWHLTRHYHRVPNMTRIIDEDCLGNDRNPVVNGKFSIAPP